MFLKSLRLKIPQKNETYKEYRVARLRVLIFAVFSTIRKKTKVFQSKEFQPKEFPPKFSLQKLTPLAKI